MAEQSSDRHSVLASLTAAALALPAFQAQPAARDEAGTASLRYSHYAESDIDAARIDNAATDRYDISVYQLRVGLPVLESWRLTADLAYESMTGASPWYVRRDSATGEPVQVMSSATIADQRTDAAMALRWYGAESEFGLVAGHSKEDDYTSVSGGMEGLWAVGSQTSVNAGVGYSDDTIEPTQSVAQPASAVEEERNSVNAVIGVTQILGPRAVLQAAVSGTLHEGFLSDPYKRASVEDVALPDSRPDEREQLAVSTRLRYRYAEWKASLHADYRFYRDSWKVESHTVDLSWWQEWGAWWVVPSLRYYSQGQAFFYRPFYTAPRADGYYSGDYRLSPYGAVTAGLMLRRRVGPHALSLSLEHYSSSASLALKNVDVENPGLVDFTIGTLGLDLDL